MAQIFYHDIGDYLSREDKLGIIAEAKSIAGLDWTEIQPNEKHDWINQRDGLFDTLIPLKAGKEEKKPEESVFTSITLGYQTNRDTWVYNFSHEAVAHNMQRMIECYNAQLEVAEPCMDPTQISWTRGLKKLASKKQQLEFQSEQFCTALYRPFNKCIVYTDEPLIEYPATRRRYFPLSTTKNLCICVNAAGETKDFSCIITDQLPDLHLIGASQCFPLYWYLENKAEAKDNLFAEDNADRWVRQDGISDWMLHRVHKAYGGADNISKEDIFFYVYGLLHSPDYRTRFADDLRKALPRIPLVDSAQDFIAFVRAGRELAELHLHYEDYPHPDSVISHLYIREEDSPKADPSHPEAYDFYAVEKMRFGKPQAEKPSATAQPQAEKPTAWAQALSQPAAKATSAKEKYDRSTIIYNAHVALQNIPLEAYDYVVNGKSAIEWVMERYAVTTDKKSGITNDPNRWCREHNDPCYILRLLGSVITVALRSKAIVADLPRLAL